ncbi:hypothetical protein CRUP_014355 [Coryphaenoides rupestris]|nr:hypothetical protein CRUP_014355 [Coryphaenoides rupestris]
MSSSVLNPFCATNTPGRSPVTGLASGSHRAVKAERDNRLASPSKQDQGTFTRLDATRRSCQVWAQSMPMKEEEEEVELTNRVKEEREVIATAEKAVQCIKTEAEDFVDETYCELDERRDAEKTQGVSLMFLSEREVITTAEKAVQCRMTEAEDFVDETDCELDERRDAEKTQGVSSMSLSRAIDPGIALKTYIALNTEERSVKFPRRYRKRHSSKKKTVEHVKRKLQFVSVSAKKVL